MFSKKTLLACGAGLISLGLLSANAHAQPNLTVGEETVEAGGSVGVSVSFENDGTVVGLNFDVNYDDTFVTNIDLGSIDGNDMGPGGVTCNDAAPGVISCAVATFPLAAINSADIGTIVFEVGAALADGETSPLTISNTNFSDEEANKVPADTLTDGSLTIGEPVGGDCILSIAPASHDFGTIGTGANASQAFTISNDGADDCTNLSVAVSGDAAFSLAGSDCGATLGASASCSATVGFSSAAEGTFGGFLNAGADGSEASAELSGAVDEDVQTPTIAIPTMQPWGLALMALLMLMIGVVSVRTFRS